MKTVVVYHSQTGFTRRYAQWIAEAAGGECLELAEAKKENLDSFDTIVYGGWACGGGISKLGWFRDHIAQWPGKKLIVFCVGGSPAGSPDIEPALQKNFTKSQLQRVRVFYCPGGFNYEKMGVPSRLAMGLFRTALRGRKEKTEEEKVMLNMISRSYDISDRRYIEPILQAIRE